MYDLVELKTDQREQSLAAKTLGQFQDQLAARNRQARDQPTTIQTDSVPGLKASNASQPADEEKEKKRLLNLFSKKAEKKTTPLYKLIPLQNQYLKKHRKPDYLPLEYNTAATWTWNR